MTDINIPPEAVEAAARAIGEETYVSNKQTLRDAATAAILAALKAWPGMNTGPNIYGRQDAMMHIPLQQENADAEA